MDKATSAVKNILQNGTEYNMYVSRNDHIYFHPVVMETEVFKGFI